jgi:hypothetical protein
MTTRLQRGFAVLATCFMVFGLTTILSATDDKEGSSKSGDQKVFDVLTDIINQGADLYNGGDQSGCYYLFKGALLTLRIQLADHADLQKAIDEGMAKADKQQYLRNRAFTLRNLLGDLRAKVNPNPKKAETKSDEKKAEIKIPGKNKAKKKEDSKKSEEKKKEDKKPDDKKPDDKEKDESKTDSKPKDK